MTLHLNTINLVDNFAAALKDKLAAAEAKYGYSDNWRTDDWEADCQRDFARHVTKGDPLDVAAYAAFCWARGYRTAPAQMEVLRTVPQITFTAEQQAYLDGSMQRGHVADTAIVFTRDLIDVERAVAAVLVDEPLGKLRSRTEAAHDLLNQMIPNVTAPDAAASEAGEVERAKAVLAAFNGGIVRIPDDSNPRGYVEYYRPLDAMLAALTTQGGADPRCAAST